MCSATPAEHSAASRSPWLRWTFNIAGVIAIAAASLFAYFIASVIWAQRCSVGFDTSNVPPPAPASPQGWLCGTEASTLAISLWCGAFIASWLLTVAFIVLAWWRWSWRGGIPALLLILVGPYVVTWAMNLPSDECTAQVHATHPAGDCVR